MKILLINSNPVVSRLTALSARKEDIQIDEIQEVTELSSNQYDIVFVDADSWSKDVNDVIEENIKTQKKVLFYAQDDEEQESFDMSILKPFLPSEVSAVIRSIESSDSSFNTEGSKEDEQHFDILEESAKEEKKDDFLLNLEDDPLSGANELNKVEEVLNESDTKSFDKSLEESFPLNNIELDDDLFKEIPKKENDSSKEIKLDKEEDLFNLDLDDVKLEDDSLDKELFSLDDKEKKDVPQKVEEELSLDDNKDLLDFNLDAEDDGLDLNLDSLEEKEEKTLSSVKPLEEEITSSLPESETKIETLMPEVKEDRLEEIPSLEPVETKKIETKILDEMEVSNIKNILELDSSNDDSVDIEELMTSTPIMFSGVEKESIADINETVEKKKKKSKRSKATSSIQADALIETLSALPMDTIKGLLSGATVKIQIKFPKVK